VRPLHFPAVLAAWQEEKRGKKALASKTPKLFTFLAVKKYIIIGLLLIFGIALFVVVVPSEVPELERPVDPVALVALLDKADRIVVYLDFSHEAKVLFSSTDRADIEALKDAVVVIPPERGVSIAGCRCGGLEVFAYQGETELVRISNVHAEAIGCSLWDSDAELKNPEKWIRWFEERGM